MAFKAALLCLALAGTAQAEKGLLSHPYESLPSTAVPAGAAGMTSGETLEYNIYWGLIYVGKSYLRIDRAVSVSSGTAWHIVSEAKSGSFIDNFYKVADRNESWMDTADGHSYGYYRKIHEGGHFFNEWVVFDGPQGRFYGEKLNKKRERSEFSGPLAGQVNDYLAAIYRLRTMDLSPGQTIEIPVHTKKPQQMSVQVGKREKIKTEYGRRKCILFEPKAGDDGLFMAKAGRRMLVWITDDELKIPMMLKAEIFIGSVTAKLVRRTVTP